MMVGYERLIKPSIFYLLLIISSFSISSCVTLQDPESSQEYRSHVVAYIQAGESSGQTIRPRRNNFDGLQLWLQIPNGENKKGGFIHLRLYENSDLSKQIHTISIPAEDIKQNFPVTFEFPQQNKSSIKNYYLHIEPDSTSTEILGSLEDRYPDGHLLVNGAVMDGDIAFRLFYKYGGNSFLEDITFWISQFWLIILMIAFVWLPGLLFLKILNRKNQCPIISNFDNGEKTAVSIAISLSITPVIYVWFFYLKFDIGKNQVILFYISVLLALLWLSRFEILNSIRLNKPKLMNVDKTYAALLIIFLASFLIRLIMIRDLTAPPWVDSVHHSLLTRMIIEQKGLPTTYAPYLDIPPVNYHSGFHINLAVLYYLTGLDLPNLMLIFGQFLNALTVFAVYLFTTSVLNNKSAGVIAAFITGLVNPMPAFYSSWGRYTQLIGIILFSASLAVILFIIQYREKNQMPALFHQFLIKFRKPIFIAVLVCAGLFLSHYRVGIFLGCFFGAYFFVLFVSNNIKQKKIKNFTQQFLIFVLILTFSLLLTLPWWIDTFHTFIAPRIFITGEARPAFQDFNWNYLIASSGKYVLLLSLLGLLLGFFQRKRFAPVFTLWILILFAIANLHSVPLPGRGLINNTSVLIFLFIPISALVGYLLHQSILYLKSFIPEKQKHHYQIFLFISVIVISIVSIRNLLPILNLQTALLRKADLPGMKWISENVPADEVILINFFPWAYDLYAGSDGGYWISPITRRQTIPPPLLYGFDKASKKILNINAFLLRASGLKDQPDKLFDLLVKENIKYIYIGTRGGLFSPQLLLQSEKYEPIYEYNGTWVIKLVSNNLH